MRYINPVGFNEKFIASGLYQYERDGREVGVESWTRHELPGGASLLRVDCDTRNVDGRSLLVEMLSDNAGRLERANVYLLFSQQPGWLEAKAQYIFFERQVQVNRTSVFHGDDGAAQPTSRTIEEIALPQGYTVHLGVCAAGNLLLPADHDSQDVKVFVPQLAGVPDDKLFGGTVESYQCVWGEVLEITIGKKIYPGQGWSIKALMPDINGDLWIDSYGTILRRDNALFQGKLVRYAHRPQIQPS